MLRWVFVKVGVANNQARTQSIIFDENNRGINFAKSDYSSQLSQCASGNGRMLFWLQTYHWVETTQMGTKVQPVSIVKWIATIIHLIGYGMTRLNFTPYNVYLFLSQFFCGLLLGWCGKTRRLWWCMSVLLIRFWSVIFTHDFSYKRSSSAARWWLYFAVTKACNQGL